MAKRTVFGFSPLPSAVIPGTFSQILQSSLTTAFPVTGTFVVFAFELLKLSSCQVTKKLFCTLPAITGSHVMLILQVSFPDKLFPLHSSLKVKPSAGGSANSTVNIFIATLPFVPTVKTFFASVPNTTSPIGIGSGVTVIGTSPSTVLNSIF